MNKAIKVILICVLLVFLCSGLLINSRNNRAASELIIFHAGSLTVPFKEICEEFNRDYPEVRIVREAAGSRMCARKITDLHRQCDVLASADYTVIDTLLVPEYADWNIKFAANEMVIAYRPDSYNANRLNKDNWYEILMDKNATLGRSDPNSDPCGYRAVLTIKLAEKFYNQKGVTERMLTKDIRYIRPKEVDLLALLEAGELDYIFIYRSVAVQHALEILALPDQINLKNAKFVDYYKNVSIRLTGKTRGSFITRTGEPVLYGVTIPKNAPNREIALEFVRFLLEKDKGRAILESNGQSSVVPLPSDTFENLPESLKVFAQEAMK